MKSVILSIINYNTWQESISCLKSIIQHKIHLEVTTILFIDNGSTNDSLVQLQGWLAESIWSDQFLTVDTVEFLSMTDQEKNKTPFVFIRSPKNLGFSEGHNLSIHYTLTHKYDYLWILNNDTVVEKKCLLYLLKEFKSSSIGIVGSSIYNFNLQIESYGGYINKKKGRTLEVKTLQDISKLEYINGASFVLSYECMEKVGKLPKDYFLYMEEVNYCIRIKKKNLVIVSSSLSKVYHQNGNSSSSLVKEYYYVRNLLFFFKEFYPQSILCVWFYLVIHRPFMKLIRGTLTSSFLRYMYKGMIDYTRNRVGILK